LEKLDRNNALARQLGSRWRAFGPGALETECRIVESQQLPREAGYLGSVESRARRGGKGYASFFARPGELSDCCVSRDAESEATNGSSLWAHVHGKTPPNYHRLHRNSTSVAGHARNIVYWRNSNVLWQRATKLYSRSGPRREWILIAPQTGKGAVNLARVKRNTQRRRNRLHSWGCGSQFVFSGSEYALAGGTLRNGSGFGFGIWCNCSSGFGKETAPVLAWQTLIRRDTRSSARIYAYAAKIRKNNVLFRSAGENTARGLEKEKKRKNPGRRRTPSGRACAWMRACIRDLLCEDYAIRCLEINWLGPSAEEAIAR